MARLSQTNVQFEYYLEIGGKLGKYTLVRAFTHYFRPNPKIWFPRENKPTPFAGGNADGGEPHGGVG